MEGKNEKVEQGNQVGTSKAIEISKAVEISEVPEAFEQPTEEPEESTKALEQPTEETEQPTEESPEEYEEDYPEGEYPEDYGEEYPEESEDDDWEAEAGGSEPVSPGGIYSLFKSVARQKDTKRVSNLTKEELGIWNLSVRDCERIALIADVFHHPTVSDFFKKQSRIVTDTAMSKDGWFTNLFVTSKKFASRESSSSLQNLPQFKKKSKWRIFSNKENQPVQEPVQ